MPPLKNIAILTGGGDCPGLNAVIRAVVHTACRGYGIAVTGIGDGFAGLVQNQVQRLELADVSGILPRGGTILGTSNRANPFRFPVVNAAGEKGFDDLSQRVRQTMAAHKIDALIAVGGDGTQSIAQQLVDRYQLPVVGIPKTIDNDLGGTDVTFGFDTALQVATSAVDKLHSTAEAHHRIMVIEVMGRYAGWIALEAGIAGGGDVILIPEFPFHIDRIAARIKERERQGKRFSLVVVAEGAKAEGGDVVGRQVDDASDPLRLGGISQVVGRQIEQLTGSETRTTILGHVQRGGSPTPFDRILASRLGYHAVVAAVAGKFGQMVGLRGEEIRTVSIRDAIAKPRRVERENDLVQTALALGTSFGT